MYNSQADEIRDWLKAYVRNEEEIDELYERLRYIKAKAISIGCQEITDMPKAPMSTKDELAEYMIRVEELERKIHERVRAHLSSKTALEAVIGKMESPKQRKIVRCRYLYGMSWSDVIWECYHDRKDFQTKLRAYQKRVYRDHDRALLEMARKWSL